MEDKDHQGFRDDIAALRKHQEMADDQRRLDHDALTRDVRQILERLNQRAGAERLVAGMLRFLATIGLGGLATLVATWVATHVNIAWPDIHAIVAIDPPRPGAVPTK